MRASVMYFFCLALTTTHCTSEQEVKKEVDWSKEKSTKLAENLAFEEDLHVQMYLDSRPKWQMTKTGTGLRYWIYKNGEGAQAASGLLAEVILKMEGLEGSVFYETTTGEIDHFMIDKSERESGLHEAIKYMRIGDEAKVIIPAHLGHGLVGDFDKIPPLTALVVDVKLKGLIKR